MPTPPTDVASFTASGVRSRRRETPGLDFHSDNECFRRFVDTELHVRTAAVCMLSMFHFVKQPARPYFHLNASKRTVLGLCVQTGAYRGLHFTHEEREGVAVASTSNRGIRFP